MHDHEDISTNRVSPYVFWLPMLAVLLLIGYWATQSIAVEPDVRRVLGRADRHLSGRRVDLADKDIAAALSRTRRKIDTYNVALKLYVDSESLPDFIKAERIARLTREMLDLNDAGKLDRKLTAEEAKSLLMLYADRSYLLSRKDDVLWAARQTYTRWPDDAEAQNTLGYFLADYDMDLDRSHGLIRQALRKAPNHPGIIDSLGWVYFRQGRYAAAVRELRRAVNGAPGVAEIRFHLAEAYAALGKKAEARIEYLKALDCGDTGHVHARARAGLQKMQIAPRNNPVLLKS